MQNSHFSSNTSVYLLGIDKTKSLYFSVVSYSNLWLNTTLLHDSSLSIVDSVVKKLFNLPTESLPTNRKRALFPMSHVTVLQFYRRVSHLPEGRISLTVVNWRMPTGFVLRTRNIRKMPWDINEYLAAAT